MRTQLTVGQARGPAPWGFLVPPQNGLPGVAVFAQVELAVRASPSAGAPGAFSARGSRETADGAAFYLGMTHRMATLRLSLRAPEPRRLFAVRGAALLGALAAARAAGDEPSRADLVDWADALRLGWSPDLPAGSLLGAWLIAAPPAAQALWASPDDPRLDVRAARTLPALLEAVPDLQPIWERSSAQGACGLTFDPQYGHAAVLFPVGNAPAAPNLPGFVAAARVGLGYAWS